jgi:hypothetical protein
MDENKLILKKLLLKYDYLESCLDEVNYKYAKYNTQFLKEYYELNPPTNQDELSKEHVVEESNIQENTDTLDETNIHENKDTLEGNEDDNKNGDEKQVEEENQDEEYSEEDKKWDEVLSKLYKKLSLKTHPDKHGGNNELFIEMLDAYKSKNALVLIKMCNRFNIEVVLTNDIITFIEKDILTLETKINELQHHLCWLWCNSDEETKKNFKLP